MLGPLLPRRRQDGRADDCPPTGRTTRTYAIAILTLAHESIHLSGIVGGTLSNGLAVGDPQAEAKADCYGMQWMPYVAEQLGDTPDDAQAIARYFWDKVYPLDLTLDPEYWSARLPSPAARSTCTCPARPPGPRSALVTVRPEAARTRLVSGPGAPARLAHR